MESVRASDHAADRREDVGDLGTPAGLAIRAMLVTRKGKLYRYPISVRIIKGALPKGTEWPA